MSVLTIVDLPTPEEPSSTAVTPGVRKPVSSSRPSPVTLEIASTGTPPATVATSATATSAAGWRSDFVSTITGRAPLSHARMR